MNNDIVIRVENVSKKYCKTLKHSMLYGIFDIFRNMLGLRSHSERLRDNEFWAVDDVSFELKRGETLGLIGLNGSGKTTLLKMLNGIFWPDKGKITIAGRVGALIAVGAGFHPLLTGRENIYINGAILGMSKQEVDEKFQQIVEFADIGDFLDAPVKHYSSGMFVRLGFAIAVYCEPDILLVDEILAVGDVGFRAKCYNKIAELRKKCAVIIVSHSMDAIGRACPTCLLLNNSKQVFYGPTNEAIHQYLLLCEHEKSTAESNGIILNNFKTGAVFKEGCFCIKSSDGFMISIDIKSRIFVSDAIIMLFFHKSSGEVVAEWNSKTNDINMSIEKGDQIINIKIPALHLRVGMYSISIIISSSDRLNHLLWINHGWKLSVTGNSIATGDYQVRGSMTTETGENTEAVLKNNG